MTIEDAIAKLSELKKLEQAGFGKCELTGLAEDSITVRFAAEPAEPAQTRKPVLGFAAWSGGNSNGRRNTK